MMRWQRRMIDAAIILTTLFMVTHAPQAHASPELDAMHDAAIVCRELDAGWSLDMIAREAIRQGVDVEYIADSMIRGIVVMCPDYLPVFKAWVDANRPQLNEAI